HGVEAARGLQPAGGLHTLQGQADIQAGGRGRLENRELLVPPQADVRLFRRRLDVVAETLHDLEKFVVDRLQGRLGTSVLRGDRVVGVGGRVRRRDRA